MTLKVKLEKFHEEILNEMVDRGMANSKSEAIKMVILHYNEHFGLKSLGKADAAKNPTKASFK